MKQKIVYENGIAYLPGAKAVATSYKKTEGCKDPLSLRVYPALSPWFPNVCTKARGLPCRLQC